MKWSFEGRIPKILLISFGVACFTLVAILILLVTSEELGGQPIPIEGSWHERISKIAIAVALFSILTLFALTASEIARGWRDRSLERNLALLLLLLVGNGWFSIFMCNAKFRAYALKCRSDGESYARSMGK